MSTAAPTASMDAIIAQLQETGIVPPDQLAPFIPPASNPSDPQSFTNQLVERGLLTKFQASQAAAGKAKTLLIGSYVMLDRATGGGGLLFKAMHRRMQRVVFIKPLPPSLMKTAGPRVQRDVAAAGRLAHPNLVAVQDLDEVGGAYFLVTEFVDGSDLATVAQQGKLAVDCVCGYVVQAAEALAYLHAQGTTHRDVRAESLFVDRNGVVKLFGLGAAAVEAGDAATDVAALGRVLYRLLAGAELPPGTVPALRTSRPDASQALENYCLRMMSPTPSERPTAAEVAAALKTPELATPVVESSESMFPELFAGAEEEAPTVMSAPFDPATLPPLTPTVAPLVQPAAMAPPVQVIAPAALVSVPGTPAAPAVLPPVVAVPEFAVHTAPPPAVMPVVAPSPVPATIPVIPAPEIAVVPEAVAAIPPATIAAEPSFGSFDVAPGFSPTSTAAPATTRKPTTKKIRQKPIDLPFNLKLDPQYLEPKYLAGAGAGVVVLLTLLVWLFAGGSKPGKVPAVPAAPIVRGPQPPAAAAVTPGMFNLPPSDSLTTGGNAARNQPGVEFDEFGFQKQPTAKPQSTR